MLAESDREDIIEERMDFIRRCLARRMRDSEIIAACVNPKVTLVFRPGQNGADFLAKGSIRKNYLYVVKSEMRARFAELKGEEELIRSVNTLDQAIQLAFATKNPAAVIAGVREMNHTLGVKVRLIDQDPEVVEDPAEISEAMDDSVGAPDEE